MHETKADLERLQRLLDESYQGAGEHLRSIITPDRRLDAAGVVERLPGMQVLALATVTARGEPRVGPVDGLFYRGQFYFGSADNSARFRHLRRRSAVSASAIKGEELAITVHGYAVELNPNAEEHRGFRDYLLEVYGESWHEWAAGAPYARIDAATMFTYCAPT